MLRPCSSHERAPMNATGAGTSRRRRRGKIRHLAVRGDPGAEDLRFSGSDSRLSECAPTV